ncbi:(+)-cis,cis-nepetalactol synthase neps3, variant 2 [Salvia divinorum]|uniref:(+)-cis,cis-nepetalactol synthase neps3, variant 2 n=1 Tax=Salvia divinorum TaxID=28513 RepID=A0ABD1I4B9_SALDI
MKQTGIHDVAKMKLAKYSNVDENKWFLLVLEWTDEEQVAAMIEWTAMTYGGLDVMFSNAGIISGLPQTALDLDLSEYDRVMRVNARGMVVCVKQSARKMVEM